MGTLSAPFWCLCQKLSLSPLYFNKTLLHKSSERSSLVSGPRLNSSPPAAKNPSIFSNNLSNAAPTGWGLNTVLTLVPAMWFKFTYAYDQMAKMWRSHDPSIFNKSVELVTKLRKILTYCSQMNIHENSWTVKWRSVGQSRNGGVWNFHSLVEHSTLTSRHCIPTWNTLWSKYLWIYIEVSRNRLLIESLATGDCSHSQWPSPEKYKRSVKEQKVQTFILFLEYWCWELLYQTFLQLLSRNHHMTY